MIDKDDAISALDRMLKELIDVAAKRGIAENRELKDAQYYKYECERAVDRIEGMVNAWLLGIQPDALPKVEVVENEVDRLVRFATNTGILRERKSVFFPDSERDGKKVEEKLKQMIRALAAAAFPGGDKDDFSPTVVQLLVGPHPNQYPQPTKMWMYEAKSEAEAERVKALVKTLLDGAVVTEIVEFDKEE